MRIAILGTRGIPARYSGFETLAEELGARLAARGHDVTVYCRRHPDGEGLREWRGVRRVVLPALRTKRLETLTHTFLSSLHALGSQWDAALFCNGANVVFCPLLRLRGARTILNVDGLDRERKKWGPIGRLYYSACEALSTFVPTVVVTDAHVIERYYRERWRKATVFIPYGCELPRVATNGTLQRFGLEPGKYFLYVSRLEPENNAHLVVRAFNGVSGDWRLAVVGHAPYAASYVAEVKAAAGPRVVFTGGVYGEGYRELHSHAFAYVQATEVGGTHPALVEAMAFGHGIVANGTPENREVLGDAGLYYAPGDADDLRRKLESFAASPETCTALGEKAAARAHALYRWDDVTDRYEALFAGRSA
ncbi:MAG: glycosyltransferase [Planctomycetes bacterium]|nr:glycosyltransferase [Planctomycetota bacterium]MBI3846149.1 glycosyltransferase [Planctomycetota bacterium]